MVFLGGFLVFVVLLFFYGEPSPEPDAGRAPSAVEQGELLEAEGLPWSPVPIDPTAFEKEINALEALLYATQEPGLGTGGEIEVAARRLADRLLAEAGSRQAANQNQIGMAVLAFGASVGIQEDAGYTLINLPRARGQWEKLRAEVFHPALWFLTGSTALNQAQTPQPNWADPALLTTLSDVGDELQQLTEQGRQSAMAVAEVHGDGDPQKRATEAAWLSFSRDWDRLLSGEAPRIPSVPMDVQPNAVLQAQQSLTEALRALQKLPMTAYSWTSVPAFYERERHLTTAQHRIDEARRYLSEAAVQDL